MLNANMSRLNELLKRYYENSIIVRGMVNFTLLQDLLYA